jgi:hypothetical protein
MRKSKFLIATILGALLLWGCYPDGPSYTEDLDLVITHHVPEYDFASKVTYAMPDKIVKVTGNLSEGDLPEFIPDAVASSILGRIAENMLELGWERVSLDASPDILLAPASWETTTVYYYYDYWYWWYGGYYPPYGGYYPPVYYGGSYTTGTLLMTIRDPQITGGDGNPILQWTGAINGILEQQYQATRVQPLIDKAFEQSPYLRTK